MRVASVLLLAAAVSAAPAAAHVDGGSVVTGAPGERTQFVFAEGTTRGGFQEYLTILNPGDEDVTATITWDLVEAFTGVRSRRREDIGLPRGRTTVDVNRAVGPDLDVGIRLLSPLPLVAERPLYVGADLPGAGSVSGGTTITGAPEAARAAFFAEGTTRDGFQEYLTLLNPGDSALATTITYHVVNAATTERARYAQSALLPPGRSTIDVNAEVGEGRDVSTEVSADGPFVAERPMYFAASFQGVGAVDGASTAAGATAPAPVSLLAEGTTRAGFQEYLTIVNPGPSDAVAALTYDLTDPGGTRERSVVTATVPPGRTTVDVNDAVGAGRDVSVSLLSDLPLAVERPLYFRTSFAGTGEIAGGSSVPASQSTGGRFLLAEGTTRSGFQEYLTFANPGTDLVHATATWDTTHAATGERRRTAQAVPLEPGRTTIDVNATVGPDRDVAVRVDAPAGILVERPLYFHRDFPAIPGLRAVVRDALLDPRLATGNLGASIWVEGYGEVAGRNVDVELVPASNQKLFTAAGALELLGISSTVTSTVFATGQVLSGTVEGDLVLAGAGDPLLSARGPRSLETLADSLRARGIVAVAGDLVGDETRYDSLRAAPGWKTSYLTDGYIGPLSALAVDGNWGHSDEPAYLADPVSGNLDTFRTLLAERGITVAGGNVAGSVPESALPLASLTSRTTGVLMTELLTYSDNFTAELVLKEAGLRGRGAGSTADGNTAVEDALSRRGIPAGGTLHDGSGLSLTNGRSAATIRGMLQEVVEEPWFSTFYLALPLAARTGTLYSRFTGTAAEGNLRAKTESIEGVRALSGYVTTRGGRKVVFSVLWNGSASASHATAAIDSLLAAVAADAS